MTELELDSDRVCEDPKLYPEEKETSIWFPKDQDRATVHTDEAGLTRRLLDHPESEPNRKRMTIRNGEIHSFHGTIPVGCLKILSASRESRKHSRVVSTHGHLDD